MERERKRNGDSQSINTLSKKKERKKKEIVNRVKYLNTKIIYVFIRKSVLYFSRIHSERIEYKFDLIKNRTRIVYSIL